MDIIKFGPPEVHGVNLDCDIYFTLNKPEVDTLNNTGTQAVIVAAMFPLAPPFGALLSVLILNYIGLMQERSGPNGVSVKCTLRNPALAGMYMKEFLADPI